MFTDLPHLENLKIQVLLKSCPSAYVWSYIIVAVEAAYLDKLLLWCTFLNMLQAFGIWALSVIIGYKATYFAGCYFIILTPAVISI